MIDLQQNGSNDTAQDEQILGVDEATDDFSPLISSRYLVGVPIKSFSKATLFGCEDLASNQSATILIVRSSGEPMNEDDWKQAKAYFDFPTRCAAKAPFGVCSTGRSWRLLERDNAPVVPDEEAENRQTHKRKIEQMLIGGILLVAFLSVFLLATKGGDSTSDLQATTVQSTIMKPVVEREIIELPQMNSEASDEVKVEQPVELNPNIEPEVTTEIEAHTQAVVAVREPDEASLAVKAKPPVIERTTEEYLSIDDFDQFEQIQAPEETYQAETPDGYMALPADF
jgi:hypothetical protein